MSQNQTRSSVRNEDIRTMESKDELYDKQHLSNIELDKIRNVIKTKVSGELIIKLSDLEQILYLSGQNLTTTTINEIKKKLEDTYQTDEYFLDEFESIVAPYWEELTDEDIAHILTESFQTLDAEQQGFIDKQDLIQTLTTLGDMPLNVKDVQLMFSMMKKSSAKFDYHQFVNKLCGLEKTNKKSKKKKKRKLKMKQTIS